MGFGENFFSKKFSPKTQYHYTALCIKLQVKILQKILLFSLAKTEKIWYSNIK